MMKPVTTRNFASILEAGFGVDGDDAVTARCPVCDCFSDHQEHPARIANRIRLECIHGHIWEYYFEFHKGLLYLCADIIERRSKDDRREAR
jgi:hypothetical protein